MENDQAAIQAAEGIMKDAVNAAARQQFQKFLPQLTDRQAQTSSNRLDRIFMMQAAAYGVTMDHFMANLDPAYAHVMLGVMAGQVIQHDFESNLDPDTGEPMKEGNNGKNTTDPGEQRCTGEGYRTGEG